MAAGKKLRMNPKEFLSPGIFGIIIGFLLFVLNIKLPGFLGDSIGTIGAATTPITMVIIGIQIGRMKVKDVFSGSAIYIMSFVKLIIMPLIAYVVFYVVLKDSSLLANVVILDFAMPAAMCTAIFAQQYGADYEFASKGVLITTMISIGTIPLITILLSL
jgi:predicted permease